MAHLLSPCPSRRPRASGITLSKLVQRVLWAKTHSAPESSRWPYSSTCRPSLDPKPSSSPLSWTTQCPPPARPPEVATGSGGPSLCPSGQLLYPTQAASWVPNAPSPPQATRVLAQGHPRHSARKNAPIISSVLAWRGPWAEEPGGVTRGRTRLQRLGTHSAPPAPAPFFTEAVGRQLPSEAFCDLMAMGVPAEPSLASADSGSERLGKKPPGEGREGTLGPHHQPHSAGLHTRRLWGI